jgi:hypothetical protein
MGEESQSICTPAKTASLMKSIARVSAARSFSAAGVFGATVATTAGAPLTTRISRDRLGHFDRRIERREARPLQRCVAMALAVGRHRPNDGIDRVLAFRRAGKRGEVENVRFAVTRLRRADGAHGQFVAGQRAGLVAADHVDHGRLLVDMKTTREQKSPGRSSTLAVIPRDLIRLSEVRAGTAHVVEWAPERPLEQVCKSARGPKARLALFRRYN